ncbi:hypothetical protein BCD64_00885 [Nostoc sp. MBR 210]|nr:hypothetical protein BCD64_00885 [Nostoc sp. MBR 210]
MSQDYSTWTNPILHSCDPASAWAHLFEILATLSQKSTPEEIRKQTIAPDRLLAESAWDLWQAYNSTASRTSQVIQEWWAKPFANGRATLILDALSLLHLPLLLDGAKSYGITPLSVRVTGSEIPSDTDMFAHALGVPSRSSLRNNSAPIGFALHQYEVYTDVLDIPFEDCLSSVPSNPNVFIWHTWLDDLIHVHHKRPELILKTSQQAFQSNGFWTFINRLRQGRRLLITSDHGYAVSKLFSTEEKDPDAIAILRDTFGASRYCKAQQPWNQRFMPPVAINLNGHHVILGQRKWKVQGGFPDLCHGGLSLLEVAVPFIEFSPMEG